MSGLNGEFSKKAYNSPKFMFKDLKFKCSSIKKSAFQNFKLEKVVELKFMYSHLKMLLNKMLNKLSHIFSELVANGQRPSIRLSRRDSENFFSHTTQTNATNQSKEKVNTIYTVKYGDTGKKSNQEAVDSVI